MGRCFLWPDGWKRTQRPEHSSGVYSVPALACVIGERIAVTPASEHQNGTAPSFRMAIAASLNGYGANLSGDKLTRAFYNGRNNVGTWTK
jgi:hypothetical protein